MNADLSEMSKVCRLWYKIANENIIWKTQCDLSKWKFSPSTENKQIANFSTRTGNYTDVSFF